MNQRLAASGITFLVDDDQWMDAGDRQLGDCIETQLQGSFRDVYNWNFPMRSSESGKKLVQVKDEWTYFSGEVLKASFIPLGGWRSALKGKVAVELLVDSEMPIVLSGMIDEEERTKVTSEKFLEGLSHLSGSISFYSGQLSQPIVGTITSIRELLPVPTSTGPKKIRLLTLDTAKRKPKPDLKLFRVPHEEAPPH